MRFKVPSGLFAVARDHRERIGQIIDISKSGLVFQYVSAEGVAGDELEIDILATSAGDNDRGFRVKGLPARKVADYEFTDESGTGLLTLRRCSVKFERLSPEQNSILESFIRENCVHKD
jgi:hypothetical protein